MSAKLGDTARVRFAEMVSREDERIDLAAAALLIAAEEYPRLDLALYLEKLDRFGDLARDRVAHALTAVETISAINGVLFEELRFHGNRDSYYDPRNSFLNEVIDRRTGIPITLTTVYIEVAKRIGFSVRGVGMPGHFIAKHETETGEIFIDPFNEGRVLGSVACSELLAQSTGGAIELEPQHLLAVSNKHILTRMLQNLLGIYGVVDRKRAVAVIDRILLINPDSPKHVRDRGLLLAASGDTNAAIVELERYLALDANAPDSESIREEIRSIRRGQARLN